MYYYLLKLPADLTSLEKFSFQEEQVKSNRLWKLEGSDLFLHTCEKPYTSIVANYRGKDVIDFDHHNLENKDMALLAEHFLKEGKLSSVEFNGDLEDLSGLELIPDLRRKAFKKVLTHEEIEKGCTSLKLLINEEFYNINWITVALHVEGLIREVKINSASTFGVLGSSAPTVEQEVIKLVRETLSILGINDLIFSLMDLPTHEVVAHPLARSSEVLQQIFESNGESVRLALGIPIEEWGLIRKDLERHASVSTDKVIYKHLAENLVKTLAQ